MITERLTAAHTSKGAVRAEGARPPAGRRSNRRWFLAWATSAPAWGAWLTASRTQATEPSTEGRGLARCRVVPQPGHQFAFEIEGRETLRWHYGPEYPRPFFFPFVGPSGKGLTRLGHPGAPDHDHHRSIWFAHNKVGGVDFWSEQTRARVRQKRWLCQADGETQASLAVELVWVAEDGAKPLLEQTLVAVNRPRSGGEHTLELQSTFRAPNGPVGLAQSNFGFLAVRVAKSISEYFGGGRLTDSEGRTTEAGIFERRAAWVDYSGPVADRVVEGITFFDHPENPGAPSGWHVREDGWMGAGTCMKEPRTVTAEQPLRLRYLLHAHRGPIDAAVAETVRAEFARGTFYQVVPSKQRHRHFEIV